MAPASSSIGISTRQSNNAAIVDINGDITLRSTPDVRKALLDLLRDKRHWWRRCAFRETPTAGSLFSD
jgi:hypothetical protein